MTEGRTAPRTAEKPLTLIERVRREQLVTVTIELVAEHGYAATSLALIAEAAGITKGAVLYHFPSKSAVVAAARDHVFGELAADVGGAIEAVRASEAPATYVRRMVGYMSENPHHARMVIEAMSHEGRPAPEARWGPLATLIEEAGGPGHPGSGADARTLAIIIGGAIDGIVRERLVDPDYDTTAAGEALVAMLEAQISGRARE